MKFGLTNSDLIYMRNIFQKFQEIESVIIFGSRALGNYKSGSDIDICIKGKNISFDTTSQLKAQLEEMGPLPYFIDIVDYNSIDNLELKKHIDQYGILFE